ncbi:MAG: hypothetical protein IKL52_01750 [Candidatus Gastranaerophilales bacterium]|nr:hypothetical protein [Candidatus Gastranaerophilales bacterium]
MKQQVLKALANPAHIFYVPYSLAVLNFFIQFLIWIVLFVITLISTKGAYQFPPLYFIISVIIVHSIIAIFSKRDPQLGQIITANLQLFKRKIPGKLAA